MSKLVRIECGNHAWVDLPKECAEAMTSTEATRMNLRWYRGDAREGAREGARAVLRGHVLEVSSESMYISADGLLACVPIGAGSLPLPSPGDSVQVDVIPVVGRQSRRSR